MNGKNVTWLGRRKLIFTLWAKACLSNKGQVNCPLFLLQAFGWNADTNWKRLGLFSEFHLNLQDFFIDVEMTIPIDRFYPYWFRNFLFKTSFAIIPENLLWTFPEVKFPFHNNRYTLCDAKVRVNANLIPSKAILWERISIPACEFHYFEKRFLHLLCRTN